MRRAIFINKSIEVRKQLHYARPAQVMKGVSVYCFDGYGSMLWNLRSDSAESYFKCWNTCVKLVNSVPRSTYTYLVEGHFAKEDTTMRNQVLGRYTNFFNSLLKSPSQEVCVLANVVARDPGSNTADNLQYIKELTGLSSWSTPSGRIKASLPVLKVPEKEQWRIELLESLMKLRGEKKLGILDISRVTSMIDSLCST